MRTTKLILLAMIIAFVSVTMAHAGMQVLKNQGASVNVDVKNNTDRSVLAAVKMTAFDDAGVKISQLCKQAWLGEDKTTTVEYTWTAPGYATGVYWQAKVDVDGDCPFVEVPDYDFNNYQDDSDSDSDGGDDSDADHH